MDELGRGLPVFRLHQLFDRSKMKSVSLEIGNDVRKRFCGGSIDAVHEHDAVRTGVDLCSDIVTNTLRAAMRCAFPIVRIDVPADVNAVLSNDGSKFSKPRLRSEEWVAVRRSDQRERRCV